MHEHYQFALQFDLHKLEFFLVTAAMTFHVIRYRKQMFPFLQNAKPETSELRRKE